MTCTSEVRGKPQELFAWKECQTKSGKLIDIPQHEKEKTSFTAYQMNACAYLSGTEPLTNGIAAQKHHARATSIMTPLAI
eukprot:scaffold648526_cov50-Prasinocladus_malaysianus.AAC.1